MAASDLPNATELVLRAMADNVAEALNAAGVRPYSTHITAVLVVCHPDNKSSTETPLGASLNYDRTSELWCVGDELAECVPVEPGEPDDTH